MLEGRRRGLVLIDQAAISGLTFSSTVFFLVTRDVSTFASFSLGLSAYGIVAGIFKSTIIIPFLYRGEGEDNRSSWDLMAAFTTMALVGALVGGGLLLFLIGADAHWGSALLTGGAIATGLLPSEFKRRTWLDRGDYCTAARASVAASAITSAGLVGTWWMELRSAEIAGAVFAGCFLAVYLPLPVRRLLRVTPSTIASAFAPLASVRNLVLFTNFSGLLFAAYNHMLPFVVGMFGGSSAVSVFAAGRLLTQPSWVLVTGLDNLERPNILRALRSGGMKAALIAGRNYAIAAVILSTSLALIALIGIATPALALFEERGVLFSHVTVWLISTLIVAIAFPLEVTNHVTGHERIIFFIRLFAAPLALLCIALLPFNDVALRGILAYTAGWTIIMLCNLLTVLFTNRR